jgi:hypothetical protein
MLRAKSNKSHTNDRNPRRQFVEPVPSQAGACSFSIQSGENQCSVVGSCDLRQRLSGQYPRLLIKQQICQWI